MQLRGKRQTRLKQLYWRENRPSTGIIWPLASLYQCTFTTVTDAALLTNCQVSKLLLQKIPWELVTLVCELRVTQPLAEPSFWVAILILNSAGSLRTGVSNLCSVACVQSPWKGLFFLLALGLGVARVHVFSFS